MRVCLGIAAMFFVSFGLLGLVEWAAWTLLLDGKLAAAALIGIPGPVVALWLAGLAARPVAWLATIGVRGKENK